MVKINTPKDQLHTVRKRIGKNTIIELPVDFNWQAYLELNPDVRKQGFVNEKLACEHYDKWGRSEGRQYKSSRFLPIPNQTNRNIKYVDNVYLNQPQPVTEVTYSAIPITEKKLTIIIPNKDGQSPAVTINSLYKQTFKNFDIVIVNDFDGNANRARNRGLKGVTTPYVLFSDNDIEWESTALQDMYDYLEGNPDVSFAYGSYDIGGKLDTNLQWNTSKLRERNYVSTMSMVRTVNHPTFDESILRLQDWDVWLTMVENGKKGGYIEKKIFSTKIREGITEGNRISYHEAKLIVQAKHKPKQTILAHINLNTKEEIPVIEFKDNKLRCIILGGHTDKSPFQNPMKMVEEIYGDDEKHKNTIIVFGYNRGPSFNDFKELYPDKKIIIYQFEQVYNNLSQWYNPESTNSTVIARTNQLKDWFSNVDEIWDYDINNLIFLKNEGYENVKHMPLKYANSLKRINNDVEKDIDVLFYGEINDRRNLILKELGKKYKVEIVPYGTFKDELYSYVDRSKIILNIHYYSGGIQEQVRLFDLIINNKCVVSEPSKTNYFNDLIVECELSTMSTKIDYLLKDDNWRQFDDVSSRFENFNYDKHSVLIKGRIKDYHTKKNPLFNILVRTSNRPNYFKKCIESIHKQTYENYNIIVGVDDYYSEKYAIDCGCSVVRYDFSDVDIKKRKRDENYGRPFIFNLYLNELQTYVKNGYILYIDDDDIFNDENALLKISKKIKKGNDLIMYRSQFPENRIVPSDKNFPNEPVANDLSTLCFCFNSNIDVSWEPWKLGDFRVAKYLYNNTKSIGYIDQTLTAVQRKIDGGFGIRDDIEKQ